MKELETQEEEPIFGTIPRSRQKTHVENSEDKPKCPECEYVGEMEVVEKHGCTSISWIVCLFFFTGVLFWIPMVKSGFKDRITVCPSCDHQLDI
jgi:hypothetical protein